MQRREYDQARGLWYYYDHNISTYVYDNGLRIPGATLATRSGGSEQAQTGPTTAQDVSHNQNVGDTGTSLGFENDFARLSIDRANATSDIRGASIPTGLPIHPPTARANYGGSYTTANQVRSQPAAYAYPSYTYRQSSHTYYQNATGNTNEPNPTPADEGYVNPTDVPSTTRPSDGELLENVGREVVLHPDARSTPPDFPLLSQGLWPRRILRGSERHGKKERLRPSFQIQYPGYKFYKRGVVFRVLWPELAGDVKQDITIATTSIGAYGEKTYYKIRWFVVLREGHNCCTCLSIQTYGGRGVPENKPNSHHAIMYTGQYEPRPTASEVVPTEPPMGDSIRVIGREPWNTMDPMSRVNFLKLYTVEHNVKVEDFGYVDPNDEWKLMAQFKSHWGIEDAEALPPARHTKFYDGRTFGPAPPDTRQRPYPDSSYATSYQTGYETSSATPTPTLRNPEPYHQYQSAATSAYASPSNATYPVSNYPPPVNSSNASYHVPNVPSQIASTGSTYPWSNYTTRMPSTSSTYATSGDSHYASSVTQYHNAQYHTNYPHPSSHTRHTSSTNSNSDLYEDDHRPSRVRRPPDSDSERTKRQHESRRRK